MEGDIVEAAKLIGAGLAAIGVTGGGIGIGSVVGGAVQAMGRNPDAAPLIQTNMIIALAFTEALALYGFAVGYLLFSKI